MYQVLARKYRPQTFTELIGQGHVRTTIENAIQQNRIAHGYIFAGQRGTGKTTVARILARYLNCVEGPTATPCGQCPSCREVETGGSVDVIEIDAASNRGINEMRELRESIKYRPARDRYKIFIIDEAHQITNEAFNALLKTLEEPPEWVVFVLCTTESHKIPTTIASRCQQFAFRSVDFEEVIARMKWICEQEGIEAGDDALTVLAHAGEGSVRDSLSALDQAIACCGGKLEAAEVRQLLGMFSLDTLHKVTEALAAGETRRMLEIVSELESNGRNLQHFCRELSRYFRNLVVAKIVGPGNRLISAPPEEQQRMAEIAAGFSEEDLTRYLQISLNLFRELQFSLQPRLHMEMGLLKLVHAGRLMPIEEALSIASQGGGGAAPKAGTGMPAAGAKQTYPTARNFTAPKPKKVEPKASAPRAAPSAPPDMPGAPPPMDPPEAGPVETAVAAAPAPAAKGPEDAPASGDWRKRLHDAATERELTFFADSLEGVEVSEQKGQLAFVAGKMDAYTLESEEFQQFVNSVAGRPMKVAVTVGEVSAAPIDTDKKAKVQEAEAEQRAKADPEVKHFQELFPGSQIRVVRNLKQ